MSHSNINLNTLNIYANNNFNKNINNSLSNELYTSALEESSKTDIGFTENNYPCPTENSLGLDSNLESNSIRLSNINNSNSISSTNVTSFTTTANPIPIPVNSSSYHTNENRNLTSHSYVNSVETPTTLSMENINENLNSSDNINSLSLFYQSDIDLNNSLNSNNISILNNSLMTLQSQQQQQQQQQQQKQLQQQQQQSSIQPHPPTFMTTTTANPLLSHAQAKNISFASHLSTNFNNGESNVLLSTNMNTNSLDHFTSSSTVIKQEPELESAVKMKLQNSINPLTKSYNTYVDKSPMDMDMNLEMNYPSNLSSDLSNLSSSIPIPPPPPPPPPSQPSSDINNSLDLNTIITKKISNLHIHSLMDLNNQEVSSSTPTNTNIPSTKEVFTNLHSSTPYSTNINNQFTTSATTSSSTITQAAVTTATATTTPITTASINPVNNLYYSGVNSSSLKHKISNSIIYRKSYIKKPQQQQYEKSLSNSKYLNYPLSSSLKLVKKEPGTKINYVKKKVSMKTALSSSLDTKLSCIDEINKKYNNNLLHTPHHHSVGINKDINNMISPSFVITSSEHVNKPLDNYELSNQIQQVPVSVVTPNNSYSGNNLFVRSNTLAIPTRKIRNYGCDSQSLGSSHTTKTIQNQHIVNSSLNEELFNNGSNSFPYKYNPSYHKGYFSLASQKKRKESHNATERRRRDFINEKIFELSTLIPESFFDQCANENRTHKGVILQKSVDYINHLLKSLKTQQEYTSKLEKEINSQASSTPQNS
ncbi:hypothetical protein LY90DRAFT_505580 [Neocallimastix californiae]|uniref:BHLH domain-containing protein n=1 Tax=Neocallimastix californiae TaxID=1754190 RepID=A0A1Y2DRF7_9FUNG|nr:hypothetical protein LY90DRAFT_505580 [Neocallimastix californiae]|eukprot:ORY61863.1 hypothetical protein LY90DRAFT_505580 [Neocallimastix californiae]